MEDDKLVLYSYDQDLEDHLIEFKEYNTHEEFIIINKITVEDNENL